MSAVKQNESSPAGDVMAGMIYVYCLARGERFGVIEGPAVDGNKDFIFHHHGNIMAVTSEVSAEEFCSSAAQERMEELEWVGPRACAHMKVIEQAMQYSPVLPFPFGTIFYTFYTLDDRLSRNAEIIEQFLSYVEEKEEWAIKGLMSAQAAREAIYADLWAQDIQNVPDSPGKRYFYERKLRANAETKLRELTQSLAKSFAADISDFAAEKRVRKILPSADAESDEEVFLNLAVLVPEKKTPDLFSCLDEANSALLGRSMRFQLSGPWPPYSFTPALE